MPAPNHLRVDVDVVHENMGHDAPVGVAPHQGKPHVAVVHQRPQSGARGIAMRLPMLRRVDVGQADIHMSAAGGNHDAVAVLDANHLFAARGARHRHDQ